MSLEPLGFGPFFSDQIAHDPGAGLTPARVSFAAHGRYRLLLEDGERDAVAAGNLTSPTDPLDRPGVGDWVLCEQDVVRRRLARRTELVRRAAGGVARPQLIAANVDTVFVVASCNQELNPRRIERYLTAIRDGGAAPVIILNKADLVSDAAAVFDQLGPVTAMAPTILTSAVDGRGLDALRTHLGSGLTVALTGSSGVGKSSLINLLLGQGVERIGEVRGDDDKGRHTTTHRRLHRLPDDGGLLIDTPGMRELGLWSDGAGEAAAFADLDALAAQCRFRDCGHDREPGCAVRGAVEPERITAWRKLGVERAWVQTQKQAILRTGSQRNRTTSRPARNKKKLD